MANNESMTTVSLELTKREAETLYKILDNERCMIEGFYKIYGSFGHPMVCYDMDMEKVGSIKKILPALRTAF